MTKDELLASIEGERDAWNALVSEVGEGRMEEPGPMGAWTFKDLAAHLTGWRERTIGRIEAAGRSEPEPPPHGRPSSPRMTRSTTGSTASIVIGRCTMSSPTRTGPMSASRRRLPRFPRRR